MGRRLLLTVFVLLLPFAVFFQPSRGEVNIRMDQWFPYEFLRAGKPAGISVDVVREALRRMGEPIKSIEVIPWGRGLDEVAKGEADMLLSGVWTREREAAYQFPDEHIGCLTWQIYAVAPGQQLEGVVGLTRHFSYPKDISDLIAGMTIDAQAPNDKALMRKLIAGRISAAVLDVYSAGQLAAELGVNVYPIIDTVYVPLYPLLSPALSTDFMDRFNNVIRSMKDDGMLSAIISEYGLTCPKTLSKTGH